MLKQNRELRDGLRDLMPRLWRYGLVLSGSDDQARELAQATALRALEKADQYQPGTRLDHWCMAILSSIWKNELRARAVRRGQGLVPADEAGLLARDNGDVNILAAQVLSQMMTLPEAQRETMYLVYVEGFSYAEAAARLEIPVGTVMSRLAIGRKRLKEAMGE
ncbi:MAG: sigma-70 family RNA polymerase sigma factor [Pseudomonadota bacterium]